MKGWRLVSKNGSGKDFVCKLWTGGEEQPGKHNRGIWVMLSYGFPPRVGYDCEANIKPWKKIIRRKNYVFFNFLFILMSVATKSSSSDDKRNHGIPKRSFWQDNAIAFDVGTCKEFLLSFGNPLEYLDQLLNSTLVSCFRCH